MRLKPWILLLLLLVAGVRDAGAGAITVGARITLTPDTFVLPIEITGGVGTTEWAFGLTYDASDVQINVACDPFGTDPYCSLFTGPITEGDFFASGAPFNLLVPGVIELDPVTLAQTGHLFDVHGMYGGGIPAHSGSGTLAFVEFLIVGDGDGSIAVDESITSVPEPVTAALLAMGLVAAAGRRSLSRARSAFQSNTDRS